MSRAAIVHLIIDPSVFAVPKNPSTAAGQRYVKQLINWCRFLRRLRGYCSISSAIINSCWQNNLFPSLNVLRQLTVETEFASVEDLRSVLRTLSDLQPFTEEFSGIEEVVMGDASQVLPEVYVRRLPTPLQQPFKDSLFCAAVGIRKDWAVKTLFFGTDIVADATTTLRLEGRVQMIAVRSGDVRDEAIEIASDIPILHGPLALCRHLDIEFIYTDPEIATVAALLRSREGIQVEWDEIVVRSGPKFVPSIDECGIAKTRATLERLYFLAAMALIGKLSGLEGASVHPVRTGSAADSPQVERTDGSKLWRCMLTKEGAGYRLHYWGLKHGGIELEAVMPEKNV